MDRQSHGRIIHVSTVWMWQEQKVKQTVRRGSQKMSFAICNLKWILEIKCLAGNGDDDLFRALGLSITDSNFVSMDGKPRDNANRFRRVDENEMDSYEEARQSKRTKLNTKWAVRMFQSKYSTTFTDLCNINAFLECTNNCSVFVFSCDV